MLSLVFRASAWAGLAAGLIDMNKPVCSVCVANINGMATLAMCLDSVLNQARGFSVEILVHDDASSDESVTFITFRVFRVFRGSVFPASRTIKSWE